MRTHRIVPVWVVVVLVLLAGCEDSIGPPPVEPPPFTLYGALDARADTQAIIVLPIRDTLGLDPPRPLDARVTSEDRATGAVQVWRDSLVRLPDGRTRHVFWAPFRAEPNHTYRLRAERSDGAASQVDVPMPPEATIERLPPVLPVGNRVLLPVELRDAPVVLNAAVRYVLSLPATNTVDSVTVAYDAAPLGDALAAHRIEIDLSADARTIREALGFTVPIRLVAMHLEVFVASDPWRPPGGEFDPDVLILPQRFSNVTNGFGFVGGGYTETLRWTPADSLRERVGL